MSTTQGHKLQLLFSVFICTFFWIAREVYWAATNLESHVKTTENKFCLGFVITIVMLTVSAFTIDLQYKK